MTRSGDRVIPQSGIGRSGDWRIADIADTARHWVDGLWRAWRVTIAVLREIFDESAYDRFLLRTRAVRSVESYREFLREREMVVARKTRCC